MSDDDKHCAHKSSAHSYIRCLSFVGNHRIYGKSSRTQRNQLRLHFIFAGADFTCKLTDSIFVCASFQPQLPEVSITPSDSCASKMSNKGDVQPLINFKHLKGFRAFSDDGKIETILFLDAAKEIVTQIGEYHCVCVSVIHDTLSSTDDRLRAYMILK